MVGAVVLPPVMRGMTDASEIRKPSTPLTFRVRASTTASIIGAHATGADRVIIGIGALADDVLPICIGFTVSGEQIFDDTRANLA